MKTILLVKAFEFSPIFAQATGLGQGASRAMGIVMLIGFIFGTICVIGGGFAIRRGDTDAGKLSIIGGLIILLGMLAHWTGPASTLGFAVIPARPRKPRDKAKVEQAVLLAERWIIAALRHHRFTDIFEVNDAIGSVIEQKAQSIVAYGFNAGNARSCHLSTLLQRLACSTTSSLGSPSALHPPDPSATPVRGSGHRPPPDRSIEVTIV